MGNIQTRETFNNIDYTPPPPNFVYPKKYSQQFSIAFCISYLNSKEEKNIYIYNRIAKFIKNACRDKFYQPNLNSFKTALQNSDFNFSSQQQICSIMISRNKNFSDKEILSELSNQLQLDLQNQNNDMNLHIYSMICPHKCFNASSAEFFEFKCLIPFSIFPKDYDLDFFQDQILRIIGSFKSCQNQSYNIDYPCIFQVSKKFQINDSSKDYIYFIIQGDKHRCSLFLKMIQIAFNVIYNKISIESLPQYDSKIQEFEQTIPSFGVFLSRVYYPQKKGEFNSDSDVEFKKIQPIIDQWSQQHFIPNIAKSINEDILNNWLTLIKTQ